MSLMPRTHLVQKLIVKHVRQGNEQYMTKQDLIKSIESLAAQAYMETKDLVDIYNLSSEEIHQILRDYGKTDRYEFIDFGDNGRLVLR